MVHRWSEILAMLEAEPYATTLRVPRHLCEHPLDGGLRQSIGMPQGQRRDYRLKLPDRRCLHVRDFGVYYEAHVDEVDPGHSPIMHLVKDVPTAYLTSTAALGGILGLLLGRSRRAMVAGLVAGAALGNLSRKAIARRKALPAPAADPDDDAAPDTPPTSVVASG
ncbi:MAG TPA: hypothetical protein VGQ83_30925 [Polyangia bacterium]|jgi:hypothetical protein